MRGITYTTMVMTDGKRSIFGVFRVPMRRPPGKSFSLHRAELIASVSHEGRFASAEDMCSFCERSSLEHARPEWPAFEWKGDGNA